MEITRKQELENKVNYYWHLYLKFQLDADRKQADADYIKKLHDLAEDELQYFEKYGHD